MVLIILLFVLLALYAFFFGIGLMQLIAPWEYDVTANTFMAYHHAVDRYMAVWAKRMAQVQMGLSLLLLILDYQHWQTLLYWLRIGALGCVVGAVVIAITGNVPLNRLINGWSSDSPPPDWGAIRQRWLGYHRSRAWFSIVGFALFTTSILLMIS